MTYTQDGITANCPVKNILPADWLAASLNKWPQNPTVLLSAIEITDKQFDELSGLC